MPAKKKDRPVKYPKLAAYMKKQFLAWQADTGEIEELQGFANHLGINENYVGKYLRGDHRPTDDNVIRIANKLGPEIYDILGWVKPIQHSSDR